MVPDDFDVPRVLDAPPFHLEPLGPQHNEADHAAWTSSIEHIRATPGWAGGTWPPLEGMSLEQNRGDLEEHAADFESRKGFTYTVLDARTRDVIGCLYIYPHRDGTPGTKVRSWVRASHAHLDGPLHDVVSEWIADWPLAKDAEYAKRSG
ncbi:N-acetyltransferase [Phytomonospora sp. NPDC050363]|uniref:N-acetyltransferase n=1 Tax=Phytomonospora sp. NPDC050363 TaxID=3155642 RepID=UPI00341112D7